MKTITLCGNPSCGGCPSIKEDEKKGIMYIVDKDQEIAFNAEQVIKLTDYLKKRRIVSLDTR